MNTYEILGRLKDHRMDLEIGGDLRTAEAVNAAIAMLEERARYDWLSADKARDEVDRVRVQLEALGGLLGNLASTLARVKPFVPRGTYHEDVERHEAQLLGVIDSILHPSIYKKAGDL